MVCVISDVRAFVVAEACCVHVPPSVIALDRLACAAQEGARGREGVRVHGKIQQATCINASGGHLTAALGVAAMCMPCTCVCVCVCAAATSVLRAPLCLRHAHKHGALPAGPAYAPPQDDVNWST